MAISTKSALYDYILRQLGAPLVNVEVTEDQVNDVIDSTVQLFSSYALEGELTKYVKMTISSPCNITLNPAVKSIQKVTKGGGLSFAGMAGGGGYVLDYFSLQAMGFSMNDAIGSTLLLSSTRSLMDKFFGNDMTFEFNPNKKVLEISEVYDGAIIIEMNTEYIADTVDYIYDHTWIKRMCIAKVKLLQSDTTGKYDSNLVGGARINHEKMQSRAENEIEVLKQELLDKWIGPAPMIVG
jgi:hypothetical protein